MKKNVLIGGLTGGVVFFFLGWLLYGMLLADFMATHTNQSLNVPMEKMNMLAMLFSNISYGFLIALVLDWSSTTDILKGLMKGAAIGALVSLSLDLNFYSMTTMFMSRRAILVDVAAYSVMAGVAGAAIAFVSSKSAK